MKAIDAVILPKAFQDTVVTVTTKDRSYLLRTRVHWRIKAGYLIGLLGVRLIDIGMRMAGMTVRKETQTDEPERAA